MRSILLTLAISLAAVLSTTTSTAFAHTLPEAGDISDWQTVGDATWGFNENVLTNENNEGDGFILAPGQYENFILSVEFFVEAQTNSGVFVRCQNAEQISPITCLEANIWDEHPKQEFRTGSIVARAFPPMAHVSTVGKWNTMQVRANGTTVEVRVNGELTATLDDVELGAGFIALQRFETGKVQFRNISITELDHANE